MVENVLVVCVDVGGCWDGDGLAERLVECFQKRRVLKMVWEVFEALLG